MSISKHPGSASRLDEAIYSPESSGGGSLRMAWAALVQSAPLAYRLLIRDVSSRYRQSILGYGWALLPPLATAALFVFLRDNNVVNIGATPIPYAAYVLLGMLLWQVLSSGIVACARSLSDSSSLIVKINFPRESLLLAALGGVLFDSGLRLVPVVGAFAFYRILPAWTAVFLPLLLVPYAALTLGAGFALAPFNALFRDIGNALPMGMGLLMFSAPVVFPPFETWPWSLLNTWNPIAILIIAGRELVTVGSFSNPLGLAWVSALGGIVYIVGWRLFRTLMPIVAERL